jgi:hypothetical protein
MPEASRDASLLIATSYQALKRAERGDKSTQITNCVVVILFAGFFIEENLNIILKEMRKSNEMASFLGKKYPGLLEKIAWYYNHWAAASKASTKKELFAKDTNDKLLILSTLENRFPGIQEIYEFRNKVAHGEISRIANFENAVRLRKQAKSIVNELFKIAAKANYDIPRNITYNVAIITNE